MTADEARAWVAQCLANGQTVAEVWPGAAHFLGRAEAERLYGPRPAKAARPAHVPAAVGRWLRDVTKLPTAPPRALPCVHEGAVVEWCHTCQGELRHVRGCDLHERCTRGVAGGALACCATCADYAPDALPAGGARGQSVG